VITYGQDFPDPFATRSGPVDVRMWGAPATPVARATADPSIGGVTISLADVTPERVDWLWHGRLPLGKIVVLDGDPSVGKSTAAVDCAARVSTGRSWPDGDRCRSGTVLLLSAEDGLADTIRPRLDAAGGDPSRVHSLTEIRYRDEDDKIRSRPVTLGDLEHIEAAVRQTNAVLIIIDVFMAFLPGRVDSHRDQDVRGVLSGLAALAERRGCCILLLRHLNKAAGGSPLYRGGGSIGIIGAARVGLLAAEDPDDETQRVLAVTKSNLAAKADALTYRLIDSPEHGCARVEWLGTSTHSAANLLSGPRDEDERTERDEAADWLTDYLVDNGGQAAAKDVLKAARADGHSERTMQRARSRAGVKSERRGFGQGAIWVLDTTFAPHSRHSRQASEAGTNGTNDGANDCGHPANVRTTDTGKCALCIAESLR
jgi:hypothetical protein